MSGTVGIYIHIPFCIRKCPYCDFFSVEYSDDLADAYTDALIRALGTSEYGPLCADTVYFGGGTPVLLGPVRLARILEAVGRVFAIDSDAEITLETNPAATTRETLAALRRSGVNRLSVGVQSMVDEELAALGRLHSADDASGTILDADAAGFSDISADLMLAVPGQAQESLAVSIDALCALPVTHLSAYLLKIEEGTPFSAQKNALALPGDDAAADLYLDCVRLLTQRGFAQYEISNFAHGDNRSRHNLKYWRCEPYLGLGPAAHSFLHGRRFYFPRELAAFLAAGRPFSLTLPDGDGGGAQEQILLGLRLSEGVRPADLLPDSQSKALLGKARELETHGLCSVNGGCVTLTPQGFLLSNSIIATLLEAAEVF